MEEFTGEIRVFGFNYPPRDWAFCDGAELPISQHPGLFSLILTTFGGDGRRSFRLPNLIGRVVVGAGTGVTTDEEGKPQSLTTRPLGKPYGEATRDATLPPHRHRISTRGAWGNDLVTSPKNNWRSRFQNGSGNDVPSYADGPSNTSLAMRAIGPAGESKPRDNMQPHLAMNFCIALGGVFPNKS